MRGHHVVAVVVVLVIGLGAMQFLFPPEQAVGSLVAGVNMDILQMERELNMKDLPIQNIRDNTLVFNNERLTSAE